MPAVLPGRAPSQLAPVGTASERHRYKAKHYQLFALSQLRGELSNVWRYKEEEMPHLADVNDQPMPHLDDEGNPMIEGKWYHNDETQCGVYGPFDSRWQAINALRQYCRQFLGESE